MTVRGDRSHGLIVVLACALAVLVLPASARAQQEAIIDVRSNVEGALVYLNGALMGETPLLEIVAAGTHVVRVEHGSHAPFEETVTLEADTTLELVARLARVKAALRVTVDVPDAVILLDGLEVGKGTVLIDPVRAGRHALIVESPSSGRYEGRIDAQAGRLTPVAVKLRGALGSLLIRSNPTGVVAWVDGEEVGLTPVKLDPIARGSHSVRLSRDGYSELFQSVFVEPGRVAVLDAVLDEAGGQLEVSARPEDAAIFLNGVQVGTGTALLESVKPGLYSVRVTAPGHGDFVKPVEVAEGRSATLNARLDAFDTVRKGPGGRAVPLAPSDRPLVKRPGFWLGVGGAGAAITAAVVLAVTVPELLSEPPPSSREPTEAPSATFTYSIP